MVKAMEGNDVLMAFDSAASNYVPVCSEGFELNLAEEICHTLGFGCVSVCFSCSISHY